MRVLQLPLCDTGIVAGGRFELPYLGYEPSEEPSPAHPAIFYCLITIILDVYNMFPKL
jgi:hypothetical protein